MRNAIPLAILISMIGVCGCSTASNSSRSANSTDSTAQGQRARQRVELVFTGPWSFAQDSGNNRIVAIAPDVLGHSPLYLRATGSLMKAGGVYDVNLSGVASGPASTIPAMVPENISAKNTLNILETSYAGPAYVINLPPTTAIRAYYKDELTHSTAFPAQKPSTNPAPTYVTKVIFEYLTDSTTIALIKHTSDTGTKLDPLESEGIVDIGIDDAPDYSICDYGPKGTFAAMTRLVGVTHYVNYPDYNHDCDANDPQHSRGAASGGMKHSTTAGSQAIATNLLQVAGELKNYLEALKNHASDKDKEEIQKIETIVDEIGTGIRQWRPEGPNSEQKRSFVLNYDNFQSTVSKSSLPQDQRAHLASTGGDLKIFSASGKNCKAALMLLTVTP